jgi:hypothetical protein
MGHFKDNMRYSLSVRVMLCLLALSPDICSSLPNPFPEHQNERLLFRRYQIHSYLCSLSAINKHALCLDLSLEHQLAALLSVIAVYLFSPVFIAFYVLLVTRS